MNLYFADKNNGEMWHIIMLCQPLLFVGQWETENYSV
jgi:hypothetical protein